MTDTHPAVRMVVGVGETGSVVFHDWVRSDRADMQSMLERLRDRLAVLSVDLVVNYQHPVYGHARSNIARVTDHRRVDDVRLARFVGLSWTELAQASSVLMGGEPVTLSLSTMDDYALAVYQPTISGR